MEMAKANWVAASVVVVLSVASPTRAGYIQSLGHDQHCAAASGGIGSLSTIGIDSTGTLSAMRIGRIDDC
jgi:hypothetical protein